MENLPERHLECSECKKTIAVCYTEVIAKSITNIGMCADCPILRKKMNGPEHIESEGTLSSHAGLCCGGCGITADEVKRGTRLGCCLCYEVFEELILNELAIANKIPGRLLSSKKSEFLHIGHQPGQTPLLNPALKLLALHEALNETLSREDYEQAAWLRDQIKALTEEDHEGKK